MQVSIIIPVYKAEKYIRTCLNSIQAQTYSDFEAIIIDDGSPDQSGTICDEYARKDNRFHVLHQENQGVNQTRNIGIQRAQGEYIFWCDADDYVSPHWLETIMRVFKQTESDIVRFGAQNFGVGWQGRPEFCVEKSMEDLRKDAIVGRNYFGPLWNFAARRGLWKGEYVPDNISEDGYLTACLLMKAQRVVTIPEVLYYHLVDNPQSVTHEIDKDVYFNSFVIWKYRMEKCEKLFPEEIAYCIPRLLSNGVRAYCLSLIYGNLSRTKKLEIVETLKGLRKYRIGGRYRDKILRWCILRGYMWPCRLYAIHKKKKQIRKNRKIS